MYLKSQLLALALSVATSEAAHQGFNYGATNTDGSVRSQADFKSQFSAAKSLTGAPDFTSARLYTMIQGGTTNSPIEAIPAAIEEETSLLLGLWASGGGIQNEIAALKAAISQYGDKFAKLVVGISVGSEDLYRNSVAGARSPEAGPGVDPEELVQHIQDVRAAIKGTALSDALIGHVDTWDAWTNGSNSDVVNHLDWLGFDGYPYYQNSMANSIENAKSLFYDAVDKTKSAAGGKPVWITETGWPVSGDKENEAVASVANAKTFWDEVGCSLFGNTNTWWYILQDVGASPSFGIVGQSLTDKPLFDLKCPSSSSSSSSSAGKSTSTGKTNPSRDSVPSASASSGSGATSAGSSGSASAGPSAGASAAATHSASGFASKQVSASGNPSASGSGTSKVSTPATSTPLATSTNGSGSGSGSSSSNGGSGSSSSNGSASSSGSAASASPSLPDSGADRPAGSIFGAVAAFLALAIAV